MSGSGEQVINLTGATGNGENATITTTTTITATTLLQPDANRSYQQDETVVQIPSADATTATTTDTGAHSKPEHTEDQAVGIRCGYFMYGFLIGVPTFIFGIVLLRWLKLSEIQTTWFRKGWVIALYVDVILLITICILIFG